jgi:ArsR family transcriptional regulator, virulence genes transcriptional regulator
MRIEGLTMEAGALEGLQPKAAEAAQFLKLIANEHRLLILCHLADREEMTVNALADEVGLSQSALSQHLARLRDDELVTFRRDAQTLHYRISDKRALKVLETLKNVFCPQ